MKIIPVAWQDENYCYLDWRNINPIDLAAGVCVKLEGEPEEDSRSGILLADGRVWVPNGFGKDESLFISKRAVIQTLELIPSETRFYVPNSFFIGSQPGILTVPTQTGGDYRPGQVHWRLEYAPVLGGIWLRVVEGDDRYNPQVIYLKFPGYFRVGVYKLQGELYNGAGDLIATDHRYWHLSQPSSILQSGGWMDKKPPLFYSELV